jgi:tetratricopeptide (TPR) repeat protein
MSPRARVFAVVAIASVAAAAAVVGVTAWQTRGESTTAAGATAKPRPGRPPVWFVFGVRTDREARELTRGARLLRQGKVARAEAIFSRYDSLQAQLGTAFAHWPATGLEDVKRIVAAHPGPVAQFHLGYAYAWAGRNADAIAAWRRVSTQYPDAPEAVMADDILYNGKAAPGLPFIVTTFSLPALSEASLRSLARAAARPDAEAKLRYGVALWQLWRRVSAGRQFDAAARLAPDDPTARTLAAVGAFTKRAPVRAFGRLGPLTGVFPKAAVVRFHLGVLLIWTKKVEEGLAQLRLALVDDPHSVYAKEAKALISALPRHGTK